MNVNGWFNKVAGTGTAALILATPAFAQSRGDWQRSNRGSGNGNYSPDSRDSREVPSSRTYRDNERVTMQGRVTSVSHENGGYRVRIDRDSRSFWVPETFVRNRSNFRVGININLAGVLRGGEVIVDDVNDPTDSYGYGYGAYERGYIRGSSTASTMELQPCGCAILRADV